jgi:hypothetical protein
LYNSKLQLGAGAIIFCMQPCMIHSMKTAPIIQQTLQYAGENPYRNQSSGIYYALFKRDGKQIRRSLKTTDKELALANCPIFESRSNGSAAMRP